MKQSILSLILLSLLYACKQNSDTISDALFPQSIYDTENGCNVSLSDIFTDYRIIPLETTENSLIGGRSNKTIKKNDNYYIRSINDVVIFNSDGKFVNRLSAVGGGPGEYNQMYDFDIVPEFNEIWVSSDKGIYRYNCESLKYTGIIPLSFYANQFKYLNSSSFIASTPDEEQFKICSLDGNIVKSFFKNDAANNGMKSIGFVTVGNQVVFQLENTCTAICYDLSDETFYTRELIPNPIGVVTPEINREYLKKYGEIEQVAQVDKSYTQINAFRQIDDMLIMVITYPDKKRALKISKDNLFDGFIFSPDEDNEIKNDIIPDAIPLFYMTLISSDSDNSFIFRVDDMANPDNNPSLLEVHGIHPIKTL